MRFGKRVLSCFLSFAIAVTMMCGLFVLEASAVNAPTSEQEIVNRLESIKESGSLSVGKSWGNQDCLGYAGAVFYNIFGLAAPNYFDTDTCEYLNNKSSVTLIGWYDCNGKFIDNEGNQLEYSTDYSSLLKSAKPGDIIQAYIKNRTKGGVNAPLPHTMIVYNVDKINNKISILDCNRIGDNIIHLNVNGDYDYTFNEFVSYYKYVRFRIYRSTNYPSGGGYTPVPLVEPKIHLNKTSYTVGDTVTFTWDASPAESGLDHYWVTVIDPSGNKIHDNWPIAGDKSSGKNNSCSVKVNSNGIYNITVWADDGDQNNVISSSAQFTVGVTEPTIYCTTGTTNSPTYFSWTKTEGATYYNLRIWSGPAWEGDSYKDVWGVTGLESYVDLPAGTYEAYVDACNDNGYIIHSNVVKFTIENATIVSLSQCSVSMIETQAYTGKAITPKPKVTYKLGLLNLTLKEGTDYDLLYFNNINAGSAAAVVKGKGNFKDSVTVMFTISPKSINDLSLSGLSATYTGSAIRLKPTVKDGEYVLKEGTDYSISYGITGGEPREYINVPSGCAIITGLGNYTGTQQVIFNIVPKNISELNFVSVSDQTFTGSAITPKITVKYGSITLTEGTDYSISYNNNVNIGKATITISGLNDGTIYSKCNYIGTKTITFNIAAKNASCFNISSIADQTYTGSALTPAITVKDGNKTLTNGTDYTVSYCDNKSVGTATVTITGKGNYTGTKTATFKIVAKNISGFAVSDIADQTYTGSAITPAVTVKEGNITLVNGTDYTVDYTNNINVGTSNITITGKGKYSGTKTATFKIIAKNISGATISAIADQTYTGSALTPAVTVKEGSTTLTNGTHYNVSYSNNTNVGTATVTITGKGNYTGTKATTFIIVAKDITNTTISAISDQTYTGSAITPAVTVKDGSNTLTSGTDYTVAYSNNTNAGIATVTVTGKANYTGTKTATFKIVKPPKQMTGISVVVPSTAPSFYTRDDFDPTGYTLKVTYDDKSIDVIDLTLDMVSGYDKTKSGTQTLTVKYKGFSVTFKVTVEEPKATSISVSSLPKTKYFLDDPLDISGGKVTVTYANGNTGIIDMTASMVSGFASNKTGTFELTVTYGGCKTKYSISVSIDPTNAKVVLTGDGVNDNFTTLSEAFAKITSLKNNNGIYTITVSKNITEKSIVLPKAASEITIVTENSAVIYTTSASLSAFCDLAIDAGIIHTDTKGALDGKKIAVKIPKDCTLTLVKGFDDLGAVSGTATSVFVVKDDITADSVTTFGTVNIADGKSLTVNAKMSGIGTINGTVALSDAAKSSAVVTNAGKAAFVLAQGVNNKGAKILPKLTVTDVADDLTITVVDGNGNEVDLESGTSIITAGNAKTDFTNKVKITNKTDSGYDLDAFIYNKDIRAEYAGAMTVNSTDYPNFEQAFSHLNATGENTIILHDDISPAKFTLPTKIEKLTIKSVDETRTITLNKVTSLAPAFDLTLEDVRIVSEGAKTFAVNGKKNITLDSFASVPAAAVKTGTGYTITVSGSTSELGALSGTKTSKLNVKSDVIAASIATFGNVAVEDGSTLTVTGKVSAVTKLDGTLKITNAAKATTAAITNVGDAKIILTSEDGVLAKTTINDVITELEVEIVDAAGNKITVPSGTAILTSGGKSDFTDKITVSNNDSDMHDLSAFLYKKEIRAEFAGVLSVSGNGIDRNFPNFETAINAINDREKDTKANGDYVITINGDTSAAKFTLPKTAGSLTIRSNSDMKTLTLTGTSTLTAKYDLTLENVKIVNLNTKNAESALTISQTAGTLVLDNVVCSTLSTVKGTAKSALDLYSCSSIDTISGFGTANIYENATAGKNFNVTALNIAAGKGITVPSGKTITAKAVYGAADSFIKLEPGFKPLAFSGTVDGTIKLISDSAIAETVQILNSAKASLGVFDVSGITPDDGLDYALTRTGAKVFCKAAKLGFNGKKFVTFADICTEIENAKNASANYTIEVLADFDSGAALKFPKAGTYYSLTITSDNKKLSFTGSLTPTGNTAFENIDLSSVTAKGAAKYTITGAKNSTLTIDGCDLGLVTAIGAATTDVNISNVKFANGQAVKLTADDLIFANIDGITESVIANTIKADGAQTLKLLEKKTSQIKTGMTNDSGKITINIVTAAGADAALKKGTVIFSAFKGESFNANLANDGFVLSRDARTFKVTIAA